MSQLRVTKQCFWPHVEKDSAVDLVNMLHLFREDADYRPQVDLNEDIARNCIRDATAIHEELWGSQMSTSPQQIIDAVRKQLQHHQPGGATLEVVPEGVRQDQEWWYVPIRPSIQPAKRYEYYEALAAVENALYKSDQLTVLLVLTAP